IFMTNKELDHFLFFNNDSTINAEHKLPVLFNEYTSCPDSCYYHYTSNFWVQYKPLKISQPREGIAGKPIGENNGNWAIIPTLCLLIILARVNPFFDKTIAQYFNASVSNRFVDQLVREESAFFSPVSSLLLLFNLVVMALATPVLLQYFGLNLLSGSSTIIFFKALL